jgi:hypothetical protein
MDLLPPDVRATLARFPIGSQESLGDQAKVVVKFFDPAGRYTFFVTEGRPEGKDYLFFGYCISPLGEDCDEWGYTSLTELLPIGIRRGISIERDLYFPAAIWTVAESLARVA